MAGQSNIKVDAGTGSPVDFSVTNSAANFRQAVTIGDPLVDANYVTVANGAANVVGSMVVTNTPSVTISGTPTVTLGSASNLVGSVQISGVTNILGTITSSNLTQIAGTNVAFNNGTTSNGVQRVTISSDSTGQVSLAGGTNEVGKIIVHAETGSVYNNLTAINPTMGSIAFVTLGNNVVVGSISSKKVRVLAMNFIVGTATNIYLVDTNGAFLWGSATNPGQFSANSGIVFPANQWGHFPDSGTGNGVVMNLSTTSSVAGSITYIAV